MRLGAIHSARPPGVARLAHRATLAEAPIPDWFARASADGDPLGNDVYGDCVPAADCQIIRILGGRVDRTTALNRYRMTGFDPAAGTPDAGTDTVADMAAWCAAPILDLDGKAWPVYWASVPHGDEAEIRRALARFPLLITVGLPAAIADDPDRWSDAPEAGWVPGDQHRIVLGDWSGDHGWRVRTWGDDYWVHPDLMRLMLLSVDVPVPHPLIAPAGLEWGGIDYAALAADLETISA